MDDIIKNLKEQIKSCVESGLNLDKASWGYEEGIIITANEAKEIVNRMEVKK